MGVVYNVTRFAELYVLLMLIVLHIGRIGERFYDVTDIDSEIYKNCISHIKNLRYHSWVMV